MNASDNAITSEVIRAFQSAWSKSTKDYAARLINSEHTLQAAVYHHLRCMLRHEFSVFTEAVIRLPDGVAEETKKGKVIVDLLVCYEAEIVAAIEIKYTPRGAPTIESARKDVLSLSRITNRRRIADRVFIEMPRFRSCGADALVLSISPLRKLIFAAYCKQNSPSLQKSQFWLNFRPSTGYWQDSGSMPKNLGVALAQADEKGAAQCDFYGGPFERLMEGIEN
jgi:hypothetical protein